MNFIPKLYVAVGQNYIYQIVDLDKLSPNIYVLMGIFFIHKKVYYDVIKDWSRDLLTFFEIF
jgi:hypothetical protein